MASIIYLDDDLIQHMLMKKLLKIHIPGSSTEFFHEPEKLKIWLQENKADLILSDLNLEGESGWDLVEDFMKISDAPIVFITGHASPDDKKKAKNFPQVKQVLEKPLEKEDWEKIASLI